MKQFLHHYDRFDKWFTRNFGWFFCPRRYN